MSVRVFVVRHGNTFDKGDTVTRVGARTDLDLSPSGQAQADALARHFEAEGIVFSRALSSPLKRTVQTAEAILARQNAGVALEHAEFLREIDYGPDENQPEPDVVARIGQAALDAWETAAIVPPGWTVDPDQLTAAWRGCFAELSIQSRGRDVLTVTSNGIARFALLLAQLGDRDETGQGLKLKTGAYGVFECGEAGDVSLRDWDVRP